MIFVPQPGLITFDSPDFREVLHDCMKENNYEHFLDVLLCSKFYSYSYIL